MKWNHWGSLLLLLALSELASANFKRLAPILEAWKQKNTPGSEGEILENTFIWTGGWEKLAVLCWAVGSALPFIVFTLASLFFIPSDSISGDLVVGTTLGGNIVALSLIFGLLLSQGKLSFFRIRTITSPIFLLLATVIFAVLCLDARLSRPEGLLLVTLGIAYGFYFRRFSSEWKSYERHHASRSLLEATEGVLPVLAVGCMGLGFTVLAVLFSYPFVSWVYLGAGSNSFSALAIHIVAPLLALPSIVRAFYNIRQTDSAKALTLTGITHTCLLNTLFLCSAMALYKSLPIAASILRVDLAVLLCLTGIFAATLLIEKERGRALSWALILGFLVYTGVGIFF